MVVVSGKGEIVWYSENAPRVFGARADHDYTGKRLHEIFRQEFASERLGWIKQVLDSGQTMRVTHLYQGDQMVSTLMLLDREGEPQNVMVLARRDSRTDQDELTEVASKLIDFGPLSKLSDRELQVMVLLGHGHSVPEIAKLLHRSPRTIEQHKAAIGRKLGASAIADIARIVGEVGMQVNDLELQKFVALREEHRDTPN